MALNLKAKETLIQVGKYSGTYRYLLSPVIYNKLSDQKVISEASIRSGINKGSLKAAWDAIGSVIEAWMTEGHSVAIPGLGTMRIGLKASSVSSVEKVSSNLITSRKVVFTPSVAIKNELKQTGVSISCFDRNGKLVKTVTSTGDTTGDYELELIASPEEGGTFECAGYYDDGHVAVIKAIAAEGYQFVKWDDDEVSAERSIVVTDDISHVATFKKIGGSNTSDNTQGSGSQTQGSGSNTQGGGSTQQNPSTDQQYTLTLMSNDSNMGSVSGGGQYAKDAQATITATPKSGYLFDQWSDGNRSAQRNVFVTRNQTLIATFYQEGTTRPSEEETELPPAE